MSKLMGRDTSFFELALMPKKRAISMSKKPSSATMIFTKMVTIQVVPHNKLNHRPVTV